MSRTIIIMLFLVFSCGCVSTPKQDKDTNNISGKCPKCGEKSYDDHSQFPDFPDIVFPDMT